MIQRTGASNAARTAAVDSAEIFLEIVLLGLTAVVLEKFPGASQKSDPANARERNEKGAQRRRRRGAKNLGVSAKTRARNFKPETAEVDAEQGARKNGVV
jgi:hypothetical protein